MPRRSSDSGASARSSSPSKPTLRRSPPCARRSTPRASWEAIADAAGLSPSAAKYRWAGDDDEIAARQEASRKRKRERPSSVPTELPGESVAEAAARLGVTPQAIYQRVTRGLLRAETVELPDGRKYKRVFPDEGRRPTRTDAADARRRDQVSRSSGGGGRGAAGSRPRFAIGVATPLDDTAKHCHPGPPSPKISSETR